MDKNAMSQLRFAFADLMVKVNKNRYSKIKELVVSVGRSNRHNFPRSRRLIIPRQTSKNLKCLFVSELQTDVIQHQFENLYRISLVHINPNKVFTKIEDSHKLKLKEVELCLCSFDILTCKSLINCRNLERLCLTRFTRITPSDRTEFDNIVKQCKRDKHAFSNLNYVEFDISTMIILKSFFYHLLSSSNETKLEIDCHFVDRRHQHQIGQLFSLNDYENKEEIQHILSKLKALKFYLDDFGGLIVAKNIAECVAEWNVLQKLEMFGFEANGHIYKDAEYEYPINSINVHAILDPIVAKAKNSRLQILYAANITQPLIKQFYADTNNNKYCSHQLIIKNMFSPSIEQYIEMTDIDECPPDLWAGIAAGLVCGSWLKPWIELMDNTNIFSLQNSKVPKFEVIIVLDDEVTFWRGKESEWTNAVLALDERVYVKLSRYKHISYKLSAGHDIESSYNFRGVSIGCVCLTITPLCAKLL